MNGLQTIDLAAALNAARREELTAVMSGRSRPAPPGRLRTATGAWLVQLGTRIIGAPGDLHASSVRAVRSQ
jgi:hypothetical protein